MTERDPRRTFPKKDRLDAWLSQDGRSAISGKPLQENFHADHRVPWSKGGPTSIENCDAVLPEENLEKAAKMPINRFQWQNEFIQAWTSYSEPNFFLCALPGGGKTIASIRAAQNWIAEGGNIVVVVPTIPVKRNWRDKMKDFSLFLDENFYGFLRERYNGVVTTYAGLGSQVGVFKKLCADRPIMLIADEIHHASENEESKYGIWLREGFANAKRRLLLSGTPVRSDKETTSFLEIEDDPENPGKFRYKMHFTYDWPRALEDRVVRSITFHRIGMDEVTVEFQKRGLIKFSNDDDPFLTYALNDRRFLASVLRASNECLDRIRISDPTAAAMAVAKDVSHARIVYEQLELLGQRPEIVYADKEDSIGIIDNFRDDTSKRWIVSVRMISEGVDVQRLRVLSYLTNFATELSFRQLVGRCVRRRQNESDDQAKAHVFLPEIPRLAKYSEQIEKLQALAFRKPGPPGPSPERDFGITLGGSDPSFIGYTIHGRQYVGDRASVMKQLIQKYRIPEESASLMLDDPEFATPLKDGNLPSFSVPPWEEEDGLRKSCLDLVKQLIEIRRKKLGQINYDQQTYQRIASITNAEFKIDGLEPKKMNISQLRRRHDKLREAIFKEGRDAQ